MQVKKLHENELIVWNKILLKVENERSTLYGFAVFGYITATLASFFIERDAQSKDTQIAGFKDIEGLRPEIKELKEILVKLAEYKKI